MQFTRPARNREDVEAIARELQAADVDGIAIVMLTYGPAMRTVRALLDTRVPLMLANIQPERAITPKWDMSDLTYNQGIHGAQDQANALVRAGLPFSVITGDWQSAEFEHAFGDWARAAQAITELRRTRIGLLGYPMNGMGDILYDAAVVVAQDRTDDRERGPGPAGQANRRGHRRGGRRGHRPPRRRVRGRRATSHASVTPTRRGSK